MVNAINAILFVALAVNIPTLVALFSGLKFTPTNPNCKDDINDVKMNIRMIKAVLLLNTLAMLVSFIIMQFLA